MVWRAGPQSSKDDCIGRWNYGVILYVKKCVYQTHLLATSSFFQVFFLHSQPIIMKLFVGQQSRLSSTGSVKTYFGAVLTTVQLTLSPARYRSIGRPTCITSQKYWLTKNDSPIRSNKYGATFQSSMSITSSSMQNDENDITSYVCMVSL